MDEAYFPLRDWRLFRLAGADRKDFLHGLVTNDVKALAPGRELPCCLLTPKGLLQAHFWVYEWKEALLLACPPETAESLAAVIRKLEALSDSRLSEESARWLAYWRSRPWKEGSLPFSPLGPGGALVLLEPALRADFEACGRRLPDAEFERLRVEAGWPRFGVDMDGGTIPLEARLESAISYTKGCYMGQETISRIRHLGHVNRRLFRLRFKGPAPRAGAPVSAAGREAGRLTSAAGQAGLALLRCDAVAPGSRVLCDGQPAVVLD